MRKILLFAFFFVNVLVYAQQKLSPLRQNDTLYISDIKTTHLLFKEKIKYLDVGSSYFVIDTLNNVLKIKHTGKALSDSKSKETNLTVLTKKGSFYSLDLKYNRYPTEITYNVDTNVDNAINVGNSFSDKQVFNSYGANSFCDKEFSLKKAKTIGAKDDIRLSLLNIYYDKDKMYLILDVVNKSNITLDVGQILFRSKLHKKPRKDYVYQEQEYKPIEQCGSYSKVEAKSIKRMKFVFNKFTISDEEDFRIDLLEVNGGRTCNGIVTQYQFFRNNEIN